MRIKRTPLGITTASMALAAGIALTAATGMAMAAPKPPGPLTEFTLPSQDFAGLNGYCQDFDVKVSYSSAAAPHGQKEVWAGRGTVTVTNETSNKSLTYNASGPGTFKSIDGPAVTYDLHGPNFFWTTAGNSYQDVPEIVYTTGRVRFTYQGTFAEPGLTTAWQLNGTATDVCAALS